MRCLVGVPPADGLGGRRHAGLQRRCDGLQRGSQHRERAAQHAEPGDVRRARHRSDRRGQRLHGPNGRHRRRYWPGRSRGSGCIEQARREGKASAINLFIEAATRPGAAHGQRGRASSRTARSTLCCATSPTRPWAWSAATLSRSTAAATFLGHAVHLQWRLHDRIARQSPKLGETVAFRNVVPSIPLDTAVDELSIQALVTQLGYRLVYEPRAVVYNRGPATVADFLRQRRRIYAGHLRIRDQQAYSAPTMSAWRAGRALLGSTFVTTPQGALWTARHGRARGDRPGARPLRRAAPPTAPMRCGRCAARPRSTSSRGHECPRSTTSRSSTS